MKKFTAVLLCAALTAGLLSLSGCSSTNSASESSDGVSAKLSESQSAVSDVPTDELLASAVAAYPSDEIPTLKYYRSSQTDENADDYLDPGYAGVLFYDEYGCDMPALDALDSYSMAVPDGRKAFEIDIMKAADEADVENIKAMLTERLARKDNGDLGTYAPEETPLVDGAEIFNVGKYVILASTSDNSIAKTAIENALNG